MRFTAKARDQKQQYYGAGNPRIHAPATLIFDVEDNTLRSIITQAVAASGFLPLSGGTITGDLTLASVNIAITGSTGVKIATATSQKLGFFNATPVVQPATTGTASGFTAGSGTAVKDDSTFTGNVGSTAYRVSDIVKNLKNLGLLAS